MFGLDQKTVALIQQGGSILAVLAVAALIWVSLWLRKEIAGRLEDQKEFSRVLQKLQEEWNAKFLALSTDSIKADHEVAGALHALEKPLDAVAHEVAGVKGILNAILPTWKGGSV